MFVSGKVKEKSVYLSCLCDSGYNFMRILVANNHLRKTGGTENYTYALALQLKKMGHDVEYFTFKKGEVSDLMEHDGIGFKSRSEYDLILANHRTTVRRLRSCGFVIQTCHGTIPSLEQPTIFAAAHVSITEEVRTHLQKKGFRSYVIYNGVDCGRFRPMRPISEKLSTVLSLCQSEELNEFIRDCCNECGVKFLSSNKNTDNIWKVEDKINEADLVVGIGRSVYDAMACGRCVFSYDRREYLKGEFGDGYLDKDNFDKALLFNCSGRGFRRTFSKDEFIGEMKKYNAADGVWARQKALELFDVRVAAENYISLFRTYEKAGFVGKTCRVRLLSVLAAVVDFFGTSKR